MATASPTAAPGTLTDRDAAEFAGADGKASAMVALKILPPAVAPWLDASKARSAEGAVSLIVMGAPVTVTLLNWLPVPGGIVFVSEADSMLFA